MGRRRPHKTGPARGGRVALYVRVSAVMGRGGDDFHSPAVQVDNMRTLIGHEGLQEVAVVDDDIDVSGQTFNRKGIARIRAMVEARSIDVVAVYTLSRVGRNLAESLAFIRWLREHGVAIISATEKIDDTPEGQFMVGMWLNMAELQGNQIGEAWARIIERRARRGQIHGPVNQGYREGPDGTRIADPVLGPAVTKLFEDFADGVPLSEVTAAFGQARGKPADRRSIKDLLRNPVYIGHVVLNSTTGGRIELTDQHPALVTKEVWDRVQRRIADNRTMPPRHLEPAYSLTGFGVCLHCGYRVQIMHSHSPRESKTRRLYCQRKKLAAACEGIGTPRYVPVEHAVLAEVRTYGAELRGNPGERQAREAKRSQAWTSIPALERELERTRQAAGRLAEAWARGAVADDAYSRAMTQLTDDEAALVARLETAQIVVESPEPAKVVLLVEQLLELWPEATDRERHRLLASVLRSFNIRRGEYFGEPEADRLSAFRFRW